MIAVTGSTGNLGRLVVEALLEGVTPPAEITALARDPERAADLAARGVEVRATDYDRPDTLSAALSGVDRLLLVSSNENGRRLAQHRNVVSAADEAGVSLLVYTSVLQADTATSELVEEHRETEDVIRASGVPFVILRNGLYLENYTGNLDAALDNGAVLDSAGRGRISATSRTDYAAAAALALTGALETGTTVDLGADTAFTLEEYAAEVSRQTGKQIGYVSLPGEEFEAALVGAGLDPGFAHVYSDIGLGVSRGEQFTSSRTLSDIIGRAPTTMPAAIAAALARWSRTSLGARLRRRSPPGRRRISRRAPSPPSIATDSDTSP